jgi:tRNA pseudouridine55 synthase
MRHIPQAGTTQNNPTVNGILNLNKPQGWTSHDVVDRVRRLTGIRKVGHAGTLDPMATGVLLVCLGRATRIAEYLMAGRKRYRATLRLGIRTDSHDADGEITATAPVTVDRERVARALDAFRGPIEQVPPMVSAVKRQGQPLYKLARQGVRVERAPRSVEVNELVLNAWNPPSLDLEITCSPGTYVRALARDLGDELGCGAHLTALVRLASGDFELEDAIPLEQFTATVEADRQAESQEPRWHQLVMPLDRGLRHFPACCLDPQASRRVRTGQPLPDDVIGAPRDQLCRGYGDHDQGDGLLALLKFDADAQVWRPHKVFHPL